MAQGLIEYVGDDCINALYSAIEARSIRPGIFKTAGLKLVYSPLNGSGFVPVTHVLGDIGITDITIVPEQKDPDGNFPTCPYPNPEIFEALRLGLELAEKSGADLMLATDPDADRVGIAVKCKDGSYELLSGNEVGVLLPDLRQQGLAGLGQLFLLGLGLGEVLALGGKVGLDLRRRVPQRADRLQVDRRPDRQAGGRRRGGPLYLRL